MKVNMKKFITIKLTFCTLMKVDIKLNVIKSTSEKRTMTVVGYYVDIFFSFVMNFYYFLNYLSSYLKIKLTYLIIKYLVPISVCNLCIF